MGEAEGEAGDRSTTREGIGGLALDRPAGVSSRLSELLGGYRVRAWERQRTFDSPRPGGGAALGLVPVGESGRFLVNGSAFSARSRARSACCLQNSSSMVHSRNITDSAIQYGEPPPSSSHRAPQTPRPEEADLIPPDPVRPLGLPSPTCPCPEFQFTAGPSGGTEAPYGHRPKETIASRGRHGPDGFRRFAQDKPPWGRERSTHHSTVAPAHPVATRPGHGWGPTRPTPGRARRQRTGRRARTHPRPVIKWMESPAEAFNRLSGHGIDALLRMGTANFWRESLSPAVFDEDEEVLERSFDLRCLAAEILRVDDWDQVLMAPKLSAKSKRWRRVPLRARSSGPGLSPHRSVGSRRPCRPLR